MSGRRAAGGIRYVLLLSQPFDGDQTRARLRHDDARCLKRTEGIMNRITSRAVARVEKLNRADLAGEWTAALWLLAAVFLLATFQIY